RARHQPHHRRGAADSRHLVQPGAGRTAVAGDERQHGADGRAALPRGLRWPTTSSYAGTVDRTGFPTGRPAAVASCASSAAPRAGRGGIRRARCARAACRSRASGRWRAAAPGCSRGWCVIRRCCRPGRSARRTPSCSSNARRACARWATSSAPGWRRCAWTCPCRSTSRPRPTAASCRSGGSRPERDGIRGVSLDAPSAGRSLRWGLLLGAAVVMILRAPIYFSAPSFWAEEGTLYFGLAWTHPVREALTYRPAGYLLLCANLATTLAAALVHGGLLPLARAPLVTVLASLAVQLLPVAVIAWSRAPFWDGALRRAMGVAIVLFGALTDEIWLNTINCQPWLVVAAALLLLEPSDASSGGWWSAWLLLLGGLSAAGAGAARPAVASRARRPPA